VKTAGVRRVINLSSVSALGRAAETAGSLDETTSADPASLYSITKFAGERVVARLGDLWSMDIVSVRLTSVFGPFEHATGVRDTLSAPGQIMMAALRGEPALLSRPHLRDWLYAPDMADAVARLIAAPKLAHQLYGISSGMRWSTLKWGEALARRRPGFTCRLTQARSRPSHCTHPSTGRRCRRSGCTTNSAGRDAVFATHVGGTWLWARAVIPAMQRQGGGSIVTFASQLALAGGRGNSAYIAAKGAILSLTRTMALDFASDGIRVNAIAPGAVETPLLARGFGRRPDPEAARLQSRARHAMQRFGRPEEIAKAALYLASDDATFTTGSTLVVSTSPCSVNGVTEMM
jgi:hypothetical protein